MQAAKERILESPRDFLVWWLFQAAAVFGHRLGLL
jgi:hypothetical protein